MAQSKKRRSRSHISLLCNDLKQKRDKSMPTDNNSPNSHPADRLRAEHLLRKTIIIAGSYGSGKSEIAVNLAAMLAEGSEPVAIADLDIVNPYFRSREAGAELGLLGVRTINPEGAQLNADLPIILPEIKGAIERHEGWLILDVGGDDVGARVISSMIDSFQADDLDMFFVLNASRPDTLDVAGCLKMLRMISASARLKFTGIIANTHLMDRSTGEIAMRGLALAKEVSKAAGIPVVFVSVEPWIASELGPGQPDLPVLELHRRLLKPWEKKTA